MTVPFSSIPQDLRTPLFSVEFTGNAKNNGQATARTLIIGPKTGAGAAVANVPVISSGPSDATTQAGAGSALALMTAAYRKVDAFGEVWYLPIADPGGGAAAIGTLVFTGPSTAAGTLSLYVGGALVQVGIASGQTAAQIATAVAAAIQANPNLPLSAAVDGVDATKVNATAKNLGVIGNDIDIRLNYRGVAGGEVTPTGITCTIVTPTGGTGVPSLAAGLGNLGDRPYDVIVSAYNDSTTLAALKAFMDENTGRWAYYRKLYGHVFMAYRGSYSALTTFGLTQNDKHNTVMGVYDVPQSPYEWAAAIAAVKAVNTRAFIGRPTQAIAVPGLLPPPEQSRFDVPKRNALLHDGISTFTVASDNTVYVEQVITTYQLNAQGLADTSFLYCDDMAKIAYVLRALEGLVVRKYGNVALAENGTRLPPGSAIITPNIVRADLIAQYYELEEAGVVQDADAFAAGLVVEINAGNRNRLDVQYAGTLMGALRNFAVLGQFTA